MGAVRETVQAEPLPHRTMPARGTPILEVDGLVKRFGGLVAVSEVGFKVNAGEIVGLIGPNGAGKSTLFNAITGALASDAGRVLFLATAITHLAHPPIPPPPPPPPSP